ncbi:MAG: hypothetical protein ACODAE_11525, partial [Gemmatimonadota bacterium]
DEGFRAVRGSSDPVPEPGSSAAVEAGAEVVEGDRIRAVDVGGSAASGSQAFLDGIQRARVVLYHDAAPIVSAFGAAVVRRRSGRRLETLGAVNGALIDTDDAGVGSGEPEAPFPPAPRARAAQRANRWREGLERASAERWCRCRPTEAWLLVDGSLTLSAELAARDRAVGLVKGHRTRFFDGEPARVIAGLGVGERTSVFRPASRSISPVHSRYLRLRSPEDRDAVRGLVRVEVSPSDESAEVADRVRRRLLAERTPLSPPDPRRDRPLHPIRDCESFPRSRAPTWEAA